MMAKAWILAAVLATGTAAAEPCALPGETPMTVIRLYFGQDMPGGRKVPRAAWRHFLRDTVTPAFPDGFTVYDAQGQWMDENIRRVTREPSEVVEVAVAPGGDLQSKIAPVIARYRARFHQQSVGVVTVSGCGAF